MKRCPKTVRLKKDEIIEQIMMSMYPYSDKEEKRIQNFKKFLLLSIKYNPFGLSKVWWYDRPQKKGKK